MLTTHKISINVGRGRRPRRPEVVSVIAARPSIAESAVYASLPAEGGGPLAVEGVAAQTIKMFYGKNIETVLHAFSLSRLRDSSLPEGAFEYLCAQKRTVGDVDPYKQKR